MELLKVKKLNIKKILKKEVLKTKLFQIHIMLGQGIRINF